MQDALLDSREFGGTLRTFAPEPDPQLTPRIISAVKRQGNTWGRVFVGAARPSPLGSDGHEHVLTTASGIKPGSGILIQTYISDGREIRSDATPIGISSTLSRGGIGERVWELLDAEYRVLMAYGDSETILSVKGRDQLALEE